MKISEHFSSSELSCKCGCGSLIIIPELIDIMEYVRDYFDKPVITHSVNRCKKHNENVGGHPRSEHLSGHAMDFHVRSVTMKELQDQIIIAHCNDERLKNLGVYSNFIHVGVKDYGKKKFWDMR